ncbi:MAG: hypothetical protein BMS9Abin36_0218 [Gammaproteobacteria bacterium]|nr:MAG: hypothetical protein BMS9Abin36_0218 [Gammaproteobacteria bacterium]
MKKIITLLGILLVLFLGVGTISYAGVLKPFIKGNSFEGGEAQVVAQVKLALVAQGFKVVGTYKPYVAATVIGVTSDDLLAAASKAKNGGFGVVVRASVTEENGVWQVAYLNPTYMGTAYGLGSLAVVSEKLQKALGAEGAFGAEGLTPEQLAPGNYHYAMFMPYFNDISLLNKFASHEKALATVMANLAAGKGGTQQVYRVDLPGKSVSVFGVAIPKGDGVNKGSKDTDKEIMDIIDYKLPRSTPYLPYELMVQGKDVIALAGRFRIAVHFPDTAMMGEHGFTKIMSSPGGIKTALEAVAGYKPEKGFSIEDF